MNEQLALKVDGLVKAFPGVHALQGVSFELPPGEIWGLLGPNGSGKSTLLKCITGLYKPDQGTIQVCGLEPSKKTKELVSFLPEIDHLYRWMRVGEVVDYYGPFFEDWDPASAQEFLGFMKLDKSKKIGSLSKGMRARVKIVLAMSRNAPLILMDEPLAGIDPSSRGRIIDVILTKLSGGNQSLLLSTHEVGESESLFDSVIFLEDGKIKLIDQAEELRRQRGVSINELFKEVYA